MIEIRRIHTADKVYYEYMEKLLVDSFPPDEYRDLAQLREYADKLSHFSCSIILYANEPVGLVNYWNFGDFFYIEHFAIHPGKRNGGYGRQLMDHLKGELHLPIVLEVELPTGEFAMRRINFYKRQGFVLWERAYFQPPYKAGSEKIPMYLMVSGNMDIDKDFANVQSKIHKEIYNT